MGGRGAKSGLDNKGNKMYETFTTLKEIGGGIKIVKGANKSINYNPAESNTPNRIYAVVTEKGVLKSITFHDKNGMLKKQIDFNHYHKRRDRKIHVHNGYEHDDRNVRHDLTKREKRVIIKGFRELGGWTEADYK